MKETELHKAMVRELQQLLADLQDGKNPSNPVLDQAVRRIVHEQLPKEEIATRYWSYHD